MHQVRKLKEIVDDLQQSDDTDADTGPTEGVVVVGDMNGSIDDEAISMLFSTAVSSVSSVSSTDTSSIDTDTLRLEPHSREKGWISHLAHDGSLMGCDFVGATVPHVCVLESQLVGSFECDDMGVMAMGADNSSNHLPLLVTVQCGQQVQGLEGQEGRRTAVTGAGM